MFRCEQEADSAAGCLVKEILEGFYRDNKVKLFLTVNFAFTNKEVEAGDCVIVSKHSSQASQFKL